MRIDKRMYEKMSKIDRYKLLKEEINNRIVVLSNMGWVSNYFEQLYLSTMDKEEKEKIRKVMVKLREAREDMEKVWEDYKLE